ncbi:phosphatidate cytidylyltransferase [Deminuibacter soli]|uniref:Phosphatidate cytidylyltransferase n=1 Tax=Deminuibacter soli TaxID=2291815 RepID=A0A3E1NRI9_9BACT|nr:phosphatidate cytidylyltransferase [Deminuibacter soli]RFM30398.1 phosphatidate cytidylyltransferase [Deminuibacter soli]
MALNIETFKTRALSAVVFVVIMLAGLLVNHWTFLLLFTIIHFGCWKEYQQLVGLIDPDYKELTPIHRYGVQLMGWGFMLWMTSDAYSIGNFHLRELGWGILLTMIVVLPTAEVVLSRQLNFKLLGYSLLGLLYISLSWALMIDIRNNGLSVTHTLLPRDLGWIYPVVLIAAIWINDTMAYIVGSFIGKTPFSPISPKKTWEGTAGGAILAVAVVTLAGYFLCGLKDIAALVGISAIAAVVGTTGDLLESKLKRMAGVKDSGQMMPGHGGFLDRFDSLLLATPFAWLFLKIIGG